ncbi:MAG: T9SS type A sorting domain-containing protein [FCB group bacterium]|nr:T9SS type A sorting domain-containing protein [FCB group bacterium]MBL7120359.1 T9SS type A sorting domain-containing protein [Candidatus Neomarinimicrobiota bacterium]
MLQYLAKRVSVLCLFMVLQHLTFAQDITLISQLVNGSATVSAVNNGVLYFDSGNKIVMTNISNPSSPTVLGSFLLDATILDLDSESEWLAILDANGLFSLYIVENPELPQLLDSLSTGPVEFDPILESFAAEVSIVGPKVYVLREDSGLLVIDISDQGNCELVASYSDDTSIGYYSFTTSDSLVLIGLVTAEFMGVVKVLHHSDYTDLEFIADLSLDDTPEGLTLVGDQAYIAAGQLGLLSVDISNPTSPTVLDTSYWDGWYTQVEVSGDYAYVAADAAGMLVIDISQSDNMVDIPVGIYTSSEEYSFLQDLTIEENIAYLPYGLGGLKIVNISNPSAPVYLADGSPNSGGSAFGVDYKDDFIYIADWSNDLTIVDASDPTSPAIIRTVGFEGSAKKVRIFGDYAYVTGSYGIHIVNISDPFEASVVGEFIRSEPGGPSPHGVDVKQGKMYVAHNAMGLYVVDVTTPENPVELGHFNALDWARDVVVVDSLAYLLNLNDGGGFSAALQYMQVLNISDPNNIHEIGNWTGSNNYAWSNSISVRDTYAYILGDHGLFVIDISDPTNPLTAGVWNPGGWNFRLSEDGAYAYIAKEGGGLKVIDISNPTNPSLAASFSTIDYCADVAPRDSLVYIADADGGLLIAEHVFAPVSINPDDEIEMHISFGLDQNFPNPFNPSTSIAYSIPYSAQVEMNIYDMQGRLMKVHSVYHPSAGFYSVSWDGTDMSGRAVASGLYVCQIISGEFTRSQKMLLLR